MISFDESCYSNQYDEISDDEFSDDEISRFANTTKFLTTKFLTTKFLATKFPPPVSSINCISKSIKVYINNERNSIASKKTEIARTVRRVSALKPEQLKILV